MSASEEGAWAHGYWRSASHPNRGQRVASVAVQTRSTNLPALSLYESLGFAPAETATLYRLPATAPAPA